MQMTNAPHDEPEALRQEILALVERYHALAHRKAPFAPGRSPVPVSGRVYGAREIQTLVDSALDFWLTAGRFNDAFEKGLAERVGARRVLTVNSGSSANLVAFSALTSPKLRSRRLVPGDEVITCATGFPTTVNPAILWGMTPVFLDVELETYNIDVQALEAALSPRTRAVMIAHTLGNPFNLDAVVAFCKKHDLYLIEDCCDALGATYHGRHVGTFGDVGTLSFYPAHHITMGEGGAVFTDNALLSKVMESFRDWGRDCYCPPGRDNTCGARFGWTLGDLPSGYDHKYVYSHLGFNLKITDMQAAVGLAQLNRVDDFVAARRRNFAVLQDAFADMRDAFILPRATAGSDPSWFGYPLTIRADAPFAREQLLAYLNERGIGTRLLFGGNLLRQPYMKDRAHRAPTPLTNADIVIERTFWIGLHPDLGESELGYTVDTFRSFLANVGAGPRNGAPAACAAPTPTAPPAPQEAPPRASRFRDIDLHLRYLLVGGMNTIVGYGLFLLALAVLPNSLAALIASYLCAVAFNFFSTGRLVFANRDLGRLLPFIATHLGMLGFQAIGLRVLETAGAPAWLAGLMLLPVCVGLGFVLNKSWVFAEPSSRKAA